MPSTFVNPILLESAIRARLIASMAHADIAVTTQTIRSHIAAEEMIVEYGAAPYIIFDLMSGRFGGDFAADSFRAMYRVSAYDHPENQGGLNAAKCVQGIWGDWDPVAGGFPNYGLHMWKPTISGHTAVEFVGREYTTPHTTKCLQYSIIFEVEIFNDG